MGWALLPITYIIVILCSAIKPVHLQYYTTQHVKEPFDIRLVDGPTPLEGRLEVQHDGFWGTVCDHNDDHDQFKVAEVVCKNLGYDTAIEVKTDAFYGEGSGDIILSGVICSGTEQLLSQCHNLNWGNGNCRSDEAFGVRCTNVKDGKIPIRLVPALDRHHKYKGLIKAFYNETWGYICYDYHWGLSEANVACHQLGFSAGAFKSYKQDYDYFYDAFAITHVACTGKETNLGMCTVRGVDVKQSDMFATDPYWPWATERPLVCPSSYPSGVVCKKVETGLSDGNIAGAVVACTLLVIMLVAVPLIIVRLKKPSDNSGEDISSTNMPSTTRSMALPQSQSMDVSSTRVTSQVCLPSGSPPVVYGQKGGIIYAPQAMSIQQQMNTQSQSIVPVIVHPISAASYASSAQQPVMSNHTALNTTDSEPEQDGSSSNEYAIPANTPDVDFKEQTPLISK